MSDDKHQLFSQEVSGGIRKYFFEVNASKDGIPYLIINESRQIGTDYQHHRVTVFEENLENFLEGLEKALAYLGVPEKSKAHDMDKIRRKYPNAYKRWTPEQDQQLKHKQAQGMRVSNLAKHLQRQPSAIRSRLAKLGLSV